MLKWSDLDSSRHNPEFEARNHQRKLEMETILSSIHTTLYRAFEMRDQATFDNLYRRVKKAGEAVEMISLPMESILMREGESQEGEGYDFGDPGGATGQGRGGFRGGRGCGVHLRHICIGGDGGGQ